MTGEMINRMVAYLPESSDEVGDKLSFRQKEAARFAKHYSNLQFGSFFVRELIRTETAYPTWLESTDHYWLYRLYVYEGGTGADDVLNSVFMLQLPEMSGVLGTINAMLLTPDAPIDKIASYTGWSAEIINAHEKLFFNVRDRYDDKLFLASVVYPESRLVETQVGYADSGGLDKKLLRIGYNASIEYVAYMSGMPSTLISDLASDAAPKKLEATIMATGFVLAKTGFLNDPNCSAVRHAKNILSASKQGGELVQDTDPFLSVSQALAGELQRQKSSEARLAITAQTKLFDDQNPTMVSAGTPEDSL